MKEFILPFSKISKKDVKLAGGKGASLGEMTSAKINVPPGFVVTAESFERFLEETDLGVEIEAALDKINYKDVNSVNQASLKVRDLIHDARMPIDLQKEILSAYDSLAKTAASKYLLVAVRSSATAEDSSQASWAGELESYLNVTRQNLLGMVKKCWSWLFTERAIFYRNEKGLRRSHVSVAVVVQKMVQSEIAGVCFTVHPVTRDKNQMIIEACFGLGESLVGGEVTPDAYVLDKRHWEILDINVSEQEMMRTRKGPAGVFRKPVPGKLRHRQKLDGRQIVALAKICAAIEKHYKFPCDIEWALEKGKFYIVQSRPITTL